MFYVRGAALPSLSKHCQTALPLWCEARGYFRPSDWFIGSAVACCGSAAIDSAWKCWQCWARGDQRISAVLSLSQHSGATDRRPAGFPSVSSVPRLASQSKALARAPIIAPRAAPGTPSKSPPRGAVARHGGSRRRRVAFPRPARSAENGRGGGF